MTKRTVNFEMPYFSLPVDFANHKSATERKIGAFSNLSEGWAYGRGRTPSSGVRSLAIELLHWATSLGLYKTDAFPGENGEVALTIYTGLDYLEFVIEPDLSLTYVREIDDIEVVAVEDLSIEKAKEHLEEFAAERWNSLGWSPDNISTEQSADSSVLHLRIPQMAPASPSSTVSVSSTRLPQFVGTLIAFTPKYREIRRYSGGLTQEYFLPAAG